MEATAHILGDAIERRRAEVESSRQALFDPVTQGPNRHYLTERLSKDLAEVGRAQARVALIALDIDGFEGINNAFGYAAGDDLLRSVSRRVWSALGPEDMVGRLNADQFAAVCTGATEDKARELARQVLDGFRSPFVVNGAPHRVSATIGIALGSGEDSAEQLIARAQAALCRAKKRSRGDLELFDHAIREGIERRLEIERSLRDAPVRGELSIVAQPIVTLPDERPVGSEALLRWNHPTLGAVSPKEFIPVAEESGAIMSIGSWVLTEACGLAAKARSLPNSHSLLPLHVNISMRQLAQPNFAQDLRREVALSGAAVGDISLEITEHALLVDSSGTIDTLSQLWAMGFRVLLDDFGTGFSSLSHLQRFPIDALKIDQAFVANLARGETEDEAIVTAVIGMARSFGLDVIAEGIETREQAGRLAELGCYQGQGYLLGRPTSPAELSAFAADLEARLAQTA